jgi:hypothetical protein
MNRPNRTLIGVMTGTFVAPITAGALVALSRQAPSPARPPRIISADDCTAARLGTTIPVSSIGEAVAGVNLAAARWVPATANATAYCSIDGIMAPVDTSSNGRPINFRVVLPASWTSHAVQLGGGGMNGSIPNLTGGEAATLCSAGLPPTVVTPDISRPVSARAAPLPRDHPVTIGLSATKRSRTLAICSSRRPTMRRWC